MARAPSMRPPQPSESKYKAVRDKDGNILWDKMPQTKPWTCFLPAHQEYAAPETKVCLHPDCLGSVATTLGWPAAGALKRLREMYGKTGRTNNELKHDMAVELLLLYERFDIPVTTAHGPLVGVVRTLLSRLVKDAKTDAARSEVQSVYDVLEEYNDESTALDGLVDRPDSLAFRHEFMNILRAHMPEPVIAYLLGVINSTDLLKLGYSTKEVAALKVRCAEILREHGYEPDHITRYREAEEARKAAEEGRYEEESAQDHG
jgi:hypothetical protein